MQHCVEFCSAEVICVKYSLAFLDDRDQCVLMTPCTNSGAELICIDVSYLKQEEKYSYRKRNRNQNCYVQKSSAPAVSPELM